MPFFCLLPLIHMLSKRALPGVVRLRDAFARFCCAVVFRHACVVHYTDWDGQLAGIQELIFFVPSISFLYCHISYCRREYGGLRLHRTKTSHGGKFWNLVIMFSTQLVVQLILRINGRILWPKAPKSNRGY